MAQENNTKLPIDLKIKEDPLWFGVFEDSFESSKVSINRMIKLLSLKHIYCFKTAKSDVFIIINDFFIEEKLIYSSEEKVFVYKKKDGTKTLISKFDSWLYKLTVNNLKQIRDKQNLIENFLNIDDCKNIFKQNTISYLESTEVQDKIQQLDDEIDRKILELYFLEDKPYKEIVAIIAQKGLGKFTVIALRQKKKRALDKLRNIY